MPHFVIASKQHDALATYKYNVCTYVFRGQVEELQFLAKLLSNIILKCRLFLSQVAMPLNIHTTWKKTSAYTSRGLLQYTPFLPYTYILK